MEMTIMHVISTVDTTPASRTSITRECTCGWVTIGTIPEPAHHVPLGDRENEHLRQANAIADGTVWGEIPTPRAFTLHLGRRRGDHVINNIVVTAVWSGGSREVLMWPWTAEGLAAAQAWCDEHPTSWAASGFPVEPGSVVHVAQTSGIDRVA